MNAASSQRRRIQGDELKDGYGGGTCQVSSTLHVAALFATLEVVERQSHSRPSSYTQVGLDATVSFPLADLKLRNVLPYPIMIHAFLPRPSAVRVEILGGKPIAKVEYTYGVANPEDYDRRVEVKSSLRPGQRVLHQKGIRGFDVTSLVRIHYFDGRTEERHYFSGYRPAPKMSGWLQIMTFPSYPPCPSGRTPAIKLSAWLREQPSGLKHHWDLAVRLPGSLALPGGFPCTPVTRPWQLDLTLY